MQGNSLILFQVNLVFQSCAQLNHHRIPAVDEKHKCKHLAPFRIITAEQIKERNVNPDNENR